MPKKLIPEKFIGDSYWDGSMGKIKQAISLGNEFKLDWESFSDNKSGSARLKSSNQINYKGRFEHDDKTSGDVTACLYRNSNGCALIGKWIEEGIHYNWFAILKKVNEFP